MPSSSSSTRTTGASRSPGDPATTPLRATSRPAASSSRRRGRARRVRRAGRGTRSRLTTTSRPASVVDHTPTVVGPAPGSGRHPGSGCHMSRTLADVAPGAACPRAPGTARPHASGVADLDRDRPASAIAWSSTARRGSGTASHGPTTATWASRRSASTASTAAWSPPVTTSRPPREDAGRVLGGGLVGLARLVVATAGEALLALSTGLGAPLHVTLADLVLDHRRPLHPRDGEAALADQQHAPLRRGTAASAKAAASAGPSYVVASGRRAEKDEPSSADPRSPPSPTAARSRRGWR